MHTKDIEYAISMVAHPKALTIRTKALAQLNELQNRIIELEQKLAISDLACEEQIKINSTLLQEKEAAQQSLQADGADVRPYCRNHEIYYDFELGCPACSAHPKQTPP